MRVAVLGGGPAGASAAERLAVGGHRVTLFDEKLAWEKPCGGALTARAYDRYPFLLDNSVAKRLVSQVEIVSPFAGSAAFSLDKPVVIYSRLELNRMLLERAADAGAELVKTRVNGMERVGGRWRVETKHGPREADFCLVAMGARNPLRDAGARLTRDDMMTAMGYQAAGDQEHLTIEFPAKLHGYIWVFPRCGHLSVGIGGKGEAASSMRGRLERYMDEHGFSREGAKFYSHLIPSLSTAAWGANHVSGDGWMAVGDAAALVDPLTGEGIYYALRSGELAAEALMGGVAPEEAYRRKVEEEIAPDLEAASRAALRFYQRRVTSNMVRLLRRSPTIRDVAQDLFEGYQPYRTLKGRLKRAAVPVVGEVVRSLAG